MSGNTTVSARMGARLRADAGFSFTEMLVTIVVIVLSTSIVGAAMPAAVRAYRATVDVSNAQVLLSTTTTLLRDKLDKSSDVKVASGAPDPLGEGADLISFTDGQSGYGMRIYYGDASTELARKVADYETTYGEIPGSGRVGLQTAIVSADGNPLEADERIMAGSVTPLVSTDRATNGLVIDCDAIKYNEDTGVFTVKGLKALRDGDPSDVVAELDTITFRRIGNDA